MKNILNRLFAHQTLTKQEASEILLNMAQGQYNSAQMAAFMTVFMMRTITVEELSGFKEAMLNLCIKVDLSAFSPIDVCGTGGDGRDTFNISTLVTFILAGTGIKVAKHGNHGVSSLSGSSTVLEFLGAKFTNNYDLLQKSIEKSGVCFMHAPLFHPAMKNVAPIRKELGVKTFFNMLGPMVNPAMPPFQMVGVFSLELARLYNYLYQNTNKNFTILHALDGYDEISLTGNFKIFTREGEKMYSPNNFNLPTYQPQELFGGKNMEDSAKIFINILKNNATEAQKNVVLTNATFGIRCVQPEKSWENAFEEAKESLVSGKAFHCFEKFLEN
ncbi:MAG: anthranilate phosphoribosyltransferase [Bacteroidetes bacterium]|nr:MAG: anthranilate phosphoribosyltransferase [Bacteroidota bacterium]